MEQFCNDLNASSWRGRIAEVGIGLEFSFRYLQVPGASKTIIGVECDYAGIDLPHDMRAVSLENAKRMADVQFERAMAAAMQYEPKDNMFGLAITGAHYSDRDSNIWVCLTTLEGQSYMHFSITSAHDRRWVGRIVAERVQWFMDACLLSNDSWVHHIDNLSTFLETHNMDVLYAPGMSDAERLLLLSPRNPLVYHKGHFQRVVEYVRKYPVIYPGAFNPPTKKHLNAEDCMYEISQQHYYKGGVAIEDLLHRVRMLDAEDKPTLITQAPRFVDKHRVLAACGSTEMTFLIGADAWNKTIIMHQYPEVEWLSKEMPYAEFLILSREGLEVEENAVSETLKWTMCIDTCLYIGQSSTAIRESVYPWDHEYLTPAVAKYIKDHSLYKKQDQIDNPSQGTDDLPADQNSLPLW